MKKLYWVIYEWSGKNFSGYAPDVPGCMATAKTRAGIQSKLKGALESHLQWLQEAGDTIPEPSAKTTVDMADDPDFPNPPGYYVIAERLALKISGKKRPSKTDKNAVRELTAA